MKKEMIVACIMQISFLHLYCNTTKKQYNNYKKSMKGDIGWQIMKNEWNKRLHSAYPIPISLYNCYRTVRHEKRGIAIYILLIAFLMLHCPVTVVQRYRDGVCSLLFYTFFIICHPYVPLHLEEMIFILVYIMIRCVVATFDPEPHPFARAK